jgi:hypothetical protein
MFYFLGLCVLISVLCAVCFFLFLRVLFLLMNIIVSFLFVYVYLPLPQDRNPIAVNKYYIITDTEIAEV